MVQGVRAERIAKVYTISVLIASVSSEGSISSARIHEV